jgi:hypothetical protein
VVLVALDDYPEARLIGYLYGRPTLFEGSRVMAHFVDRNGVAMPEWTLR